MANRTVITPQSITNRNGAPVTFVPIDAVNGMQYRSTGREVILIRTAFNVSAAVVMKINSLADAKGRFDSAAIATAGVNTGDGTIQQFGPYDPNIYGDGSGNVTMDFSSTQGTGTQPLAVAVVLIN